MSGVMLMSGSMEPSTVRSVENIFPQQLFSELSARVNRFAYTYGWRSNPSIGYAHWNRDIGEAGPWNGLDITPRINEDVFKSAWEYLQNTMFQGHRLVRLYANAHTHGVEGYPHTDSIRSNDKTMVLYMNRRWRREWGGETMVYDGDKIIHAELPKANSALIFNANQYHVARAVSRLCPDARVTLMFKVSAPEFDEQRDNLQKLLEKYRAVEYSHKVTSLLGHLLGTYDRLKTIDADSTVCLAGGAHSVFGTTAYDRVLIAPEFKPEVEAVVGADAMRLIDLFSKIDRPAALVANVGKDGAVLPLKAGGEVAVTKQELDALVQIECANMVEQNEIDNYPALASAWTGGRR